MTRVLFVVGTDRGGASLSTWELARRLAPHASAAVLERSKPAIRVLSAPGRGERWWSKVRSAGARLTSSRAQRGPDVDGVASWTAPFVERAVGPVAEQFRPDVVVGCSMYQRAWSSIVLQMRQRRVPTVLYLREQSSVRLLAAEPTRVIANAPSIADSARALRPDVVMIPSVVDIAAIRTESTREHVLYLNPIPTRGLELAFDIAQATPALSFVFQESQLLHALDAEAIRLRAGALPNVELRRRVADRRSLYRDARVVLLPYLVENRPRVVLEAQANAIPVVASDIPGLRDAVGPGGVLVPPDAPPAEWRAQLEGLVGDVDRYDAACHAALEHSQRAEVSPECIVEQFLDVVSGIAAR
jgi:glycosyltransferase involved in cell wall biosynthesis